MMRWIALLVFAQSWPELCRSAKRTPFQEAWGIAPESSLFAAPCVDVDASVQRHKLAGQALLKLPRRSPELRVDGRVGTRWCTPTFISKVPDVQLDLPKGLIRLQLRICGATLLVRDTSGAWQCDLARDLSGCEVLELKDPPAGAVHVWVGGSATQFIDGEPTHLVPSPIDAELLWVTPTYDSLDAGEMRTNE